jgi:hypothetical protein
MLWEIDLAWKNFIPEFTVFEGYELEAPSTELQETKSQLHQVYFDMTTIRYVALFFAQSNGRIRAKLINSYSRMESQVVGLGRVTARSN